MPTLTDCKPLVSSELFSLFSSDRFRVKPTKDRVTIDKPHLNEGSSHDLSYSMIDFSSKDREREKQTIPPEHTKRLVEIVHLHNQSREEGKIYVTHHL